jgi:hypothetical protein
MAGSHAIFALVPDIGLITNNIFKLGAEVIIVFLLSANAMLILNDNL